MDWFSADSHLTHFNIIKYCNRPFSTVNEMDDVLIGNINKYVKPNDTLWHLGDFCFGPRDTEGFLRCAENHRKRINCKKMILIWGNHDPELFSNKKEEREKAERFRMLFDEDYSMRIVNINGHKFTLCHYAMARWDKSHRKAINLYGHSHAGIETWMDTIMPGRKSMDVGVDNIAKLFGEYRPVSIKEVIDIMNSRPGFLERHDEE